MICQEVAAAAGLPIFAPDRADWRNLVEFLRELEATPQDAEGGESLPPGLGNAISALDAVFQFLLRQQAFKEDPRGLAALRPLYTAMIDLLSGKVSPLFKPTRGKGNPGNGCENEIIKGTAARALSELMDSDMRREDAERLVAAACGEEISTVRNWRHTLNKGPGPGASQAALFAYRRPLPGGSPRERGMWLIDILRDLRAV